MTGSLPSDNGDRLDLPARRSRSNRWLAGVFVILMGGMAVAALALALGTLKSRKTRDPKVPATAPSARVFAPVELPALGYLPEGCNLVAGIHIADLLKTPTGKKLLEPPRPWFLDKGLGWIESWTGLPAGAVDHIVLGAALTGDIPQLVVVLRTRQPYRLEDVAKNFSGKAFPHHKKPLFRLKFQPVGGGYLWCADDRTLVLLLRPDTVKIEDMDHFPAFPRTAADALAEPLRKIVAEHLRHAEIWLAGDLERPEPLTNLLNLFPSVAKQLPPLAQARSFAVGVRDEGDLSILGFVRARDNTSLRPWREFLDNVPLPGVASRKVIPTPDKNQIDFQLRIPAEQVRAIVPKTP